MTGPVLIAHRLTGWHEANRVPGYIALVNIMPGKSMAKLHKAQDIFPLSAFTDTSSSSHGRHTVFAPLEKRVSDELLRINQSL